MILNIYKNWLLPRLLDWSMAGEPFTTQRRLTLAPVSGHALELGFGTGLNLLHYPEAVTALDAVDPNTSAARLARRRLAQVPFPVTHHTTLPTTPETYDWVVSTWTLCTVPDPHETLQHLRTLLKPGGRFAFVEHGLSDDPDVQRWQHRLTPVQKCLADGCHLNRPIADLIQSAFAVESLETFYAPKAPRFAGYFFRGVAVKKADQVFSPAI